VNTYQTAEESGHIPLYYTRRSRKDLSLHNNTDISGIFPEAYSGCHFQNPPLQFFQGLPKGKTPYEKFYPYPKEQITRIEAPLRYSHDR